MRRAAPRPAPRDVVMVTLGSGVGVTLLAVAPSSRARSLIEGGPATEHVSILRGDDPGGRTVARACGCGQRGCAEAYVSASSVHARFHGARMEAQAAEQLEQQEPTPMARQHERWALDCLTVLWQGRSGGSEPATNTVRVALAFTRPLAAGIQAALTKGDTVAGLDEAGASVLPVALLRRLKSSIGVSMSRPRATLSRRPLLVFVRAAIVTGIAFFSSARG
jgi:hypothetical protein